MITFPNAKINLGLQVLSRRGDGYHNILTCFYPVPFYDILEMIPATDGVFRFTLTGIHIEGRRDDNLCIKALRILGSDREVPAVHMHLHKQIPTGAGLGGGSSDAACTLILANNLFGLNFSDAMLESIALQLGSDCPFFIMNRPVIATGRGEKMEPADISLRGMTMLLFRPSFRISTHEAYGHITPEDNRLSLSVSLQQPVEQWKGNVENDFEHYVLGHYAEAKKIKKLLFDSGAVFAQMTGSGSVFYGLFRSKPVLPEYLKTRLIYSCTL